MNLKIEINPRSYKVILKDSTPVGRDGYFSEEAINPIGYNRFKKSDTISIIKVKCNKSEVCIQKENSTYTEIDLPEDGRFTVNYYVLPTLEWVERNVSALDLYAKVYCADLDKIYLYKLEGGKYLKEEIKVEDFIDIEHSTLSYTTAQFFSIINTRGCYLDLVKDLFESRALTGCFSKSNIDPELIFKRDLAWMTLNIIEYLVDLGQLEEAQRYITILHQNCNGICKSKNSTSNGCGCSQK